MAVRRLADEQPDTFSFTPENLEWAKAKIREYPEGRQASAVIPLLWRAQEQHGGWVPEPAIRLVADMLEMPYIRVFEIATFYTMFQLKPVGTVAHVGVCGTTPCMLRGSEDIIRICRERIAPRPFELSPDGRFSWEEVECAGACVNAPMVQIGADTYEDLSPETFNAVLDALERGERPKPGPQSRRRASEPITGPTTLTSRAKDDHPHEPAAGPVPGPDEDVDPTSPATAGEHIGRPAGRDRVEAEAASSTGQAPREASPVAPEPQTNGRPRSAPDIPEKQKSALEPGDEPEPPATPAPKDDRLETGAAERSHEAAGKPDRAAPGAAFAVEPVRAEKDAEITPSLAPGSAPESAGKDAPAAPDSVAAERAQAAGTRPEAVDKATVKPDDLKRISGIGPSLERTLNSLGIFTLRQIAEWTDENRAWVDAYLAFRGRVNRERWVEQARDLVAKDNGAAD